MTEQENVTEADLRQLRDTVDRLYSFALARLREANDANRKLRAATLAAYSRRRAMTSKKRDDEETERVGIGNVSTPPADLQIVGTVRCIEEALYTYGDVMDDDYNSLLTKALLEFEGKHIEVTVRVLDVGDDIKET